MTAESSPPPKPIPVRGIDGGTGTDKAMKQFSRTDAEREHAAEGASRPEAEGDGADAERNPANSTQPPPSTAPAEPGAKR